MKERVGWFVLLVLLAANLVIAAGILKELRKEQPVIEVQNIRLYCEIDKSNDNSTVNTSASKSPPEYVGVFKATAYCGCRICNGVWTGQPAANGSEMVEGITVASDWSVLPEGTRIWIPGLGYRECQDTGVNGKHIDIFMDDHGAAKAWGVQEVEIWTIRK